MSYLYFIQSGGDRDPVKIGFSKNPSTRVRELQTSSPFTLRPLFWLYVGPTYVQYVENAVHRMFADLMTLGGGDEWFYWSPDITALVEGLKAFDAKLPKTRDREVEVVVQGRRRLWWWESTSKIEWTFHRQFAPPSMPAALEEHW